MPQSSFFERLAQRAHTGRTCLAAFVRGISDEEWTWSPDDGIPSAADLTAQLLRDEARLLRRFSKQGPSDPGPTPSGASETAAELREQRARVMACVREEAAAADSDATARAAELLASLLAADAEVFGALTLLRRLIDPARPRPAFV